MARDIVIQVNGKTYTSDNLHEAADDPHVHLDVGTISGGTVINHAEGATGVVIQTGDMDDWITFS